MERLPMLARCGHSWVCGFCALTAEDRHFLNCNVCGRLASEYVPWTRYLSCLLIPRCPGCKKPADYDRGKQETAQLILKLLKQPALASSRLVNIPIGAKLALPTCPGCKKPADCMDRLPMLLRNNLLKCALCPPDTNCPEITGYAGWLTGIDKIDKIQIYMSGNIMDGLIAYFIKEFVPQLGWIDQTYKGMDLIIRASDRIVSDLAASRPELAGDAKEKLREECSKFNESGARKASANRCGV
ncbi:unnamed protein product, partial [Mesorhabditis spiculigera]